MFKFNVGTWVSRVGSFEKVHGLVQLRIKKLELGGDEYANLLIGNMGGQVGPIDKNYIWGRGAVG